MPRFAPFTTLALVSESRCLGRFSQAAVSEYCTYQLSKACFYFWLETGDKSSVDKHADTSVGAFVTGGHTGASCNEQWPQRADHTGAPCNEQWPQRADHTGAS
eukprot:4471675-Pyramimonas_sp.AAC.1